MYFLRNCFWLAAVLILLANCTGKKKPSLAGEDPVEVADFIDFFPDVKLPFQLTDTSFNSKENDSLLISYKVMTQFIPDTVLQRFFGKNVKPRIFPLGKAKVAGAETYLFAKATAGDKHTVLLFAFDKKETYLDGMEFLRTDKWVSTQQSSSMDKGYTVYNTITRRNADGSVSEGKDVYGLSDGKFSLIMTDPLDDRITEIINPIDTFSRKFKYAADYGSGKLNLVSIRDGRRKDRITFFIHFEKNNGACTGELKGEAIIRSASVAEYRQDGDPCALRFTFSSSSVTLKELDGCGAHRGLRCSFDGSFPKKREPKPAPSKKTGSG